MQTTDEASLPEMREWHGEREESGFEDLAARLDAIRARAASEGWPAWTEEDAHVIATAAADIRTIPEALAEGMKQAFTAGREYGHREERLDEINRELVVLSRFLAQRAWGGGGAGWA
jgi:hypothetical protein